LAQALASLSSDATISLTVESEKCRSICGRWAGSVAAPVDPESCPAT